MLTFKKKIYVKRILTIFFLGSIKRRGHKERSEENGHKRRAKEDGGRGGVGEDGVGEEGNAG